MAMWVPSGKGRGRDPRSAAWHREPRSANGARGAERKGADATEQPRRRTREPPKANGRGGWGVGLSAGPHVTHHFCRGKSGAKSHY